MKFRSLLAEFEIPKWTPEMAERYGKIIGLDRPAELADIRKWTREETFPRPDAPDYVRPEVPDIGLPKTLDYLIAVDDSGNSDPFFNRKGEMSKGQDSVPTLGVLGMQTNELKVFNDDWIDYREFLRERLNLQKAPPIHAILMHGPSVKPYVNRHTPNPYHNLSMNERHSCLLLAEHVLFEHIFGDKAAFSIGFGQTRSASLDEFMSMMHTTGLSADIRYLSTLKKKRDWLKWTTQRMSSPLGSAILNAVHFIDLALERLGQKKAGIIFDSFDETTGITQDFVDEILSKTLKYGNIKWVTILDGSQEYPLLQAADLLAFTLRREREMHEGFIAREPRPPRLGPIGYDIINSAGEEFDKRPESRDLRSRVIFQYAMFYRQIEKLDPKFHDLLVSPGDFRRRVDLNLQIGTRVSMFSDYDVSAHS